MRNNQQGFSALLMLLILVLAGLAVWFVVQGLTNTATNNNTETQTETQQGIQELQNRIPQAPLSGTEYREKLSAATAPKRRE